jgi:Protein of unknown function (DUF3611)
LIHPIKSTDRRRAAVMLRKAITVGVTINLLGLFLNLLAAEEIIGTLAIKVLAMSPVTSYGLGMGGPGAFLDGTLQPLDILVVQANTNALLSHFVSLSCSLYLTRIVTKLVGEVGEEDDPSTPSRG